MYKERSCLRSIWLNPLNSSDAIEVRPSWRGLWKNRVAVVWKKIAPGRTVWRSWINGRYQLLLKVVAAEKSNLGLGLAIFLMRELRSVQFESFIFGNNLIRQRPKDHRYSLFETPLFVKPAAFCYGSPEYEVFKT
jgi:hypothetical protein